MRLPSAPAWALLAGAAFWGVVWYPFRLLAQAGIDGIWSTLFTYGLALAVGNVLVRRLQHLTDAAKSIAIWAGVTLAALIHLPAGKAGAERAVSLAVEQWPVISGIGLALLLMGFALQYGLSRLPANRAIVILLSELVVAAVAAYWLAGESLRAQDGIGGALIVLATIATVWRSGK